MRTLNKTILLTFVFSSAACNLTGDECIGDCQAPDSGKNASTGDTTGDTIGDTTSDTDSTGEPDPSTSDASTSDGPVDPPLDPKYAICEPFCAMNSQCYIGDDPDVTNPGCVEACVMQLQFHGHLSEECGDLYHDAFVCFSADCNSMAQYNGVTGECYEKLRVAQKSLTCELPPTPQLCKDACANFKACGNELWECEEGCTQDLYEQDFFEDAACKATFEQYWTSERDATCDQIEKNVNKYPLKCSKVYPE